MKVLLIAANCNPEWASVPLEAWSIYKELVKICDCHLITQVRNKQALLRAGLTEDIDFTAIDTEALEIPAFKLTTKLSGGIGKGWTFGTAISSITYYYFEYLIWKKFKKQIIAKEYDLVHRVMPISPTAQSIMAKLCRKSGVPFIIGPLNGGLPWPKQFDQERRQENEWLSYVRGLYKLLPLYKSTLENSAAIICGSNYTKQQIPNKYQNKCFYIPENAIDLDKFKVKKNTRTNIPIKAIFIGRLVPYKGASMAIEASAELIKNNKLNLEIVGDGPQLEELKALTTKLNINVTFSGWINHSEIEKKFVNADIFVFPSIREFGGAVVVEAMAVGVVPIVVRYGGPSELATEETGYFIEIGSREKIIFDLKTTLDRICNNPSEIDEKSELSYNRARTLFTWEKKAKDILEIYNNVKIT